MKLLSKLFIAFISLGLLTGCNLFKSEPALPEVVAPPATMETDVEVTEPDSVETLDEEVDAMMEDEAAIDEELDALEAEEL